MQKPHNDRDIQCPGNPPGRVPQVVKAGSGRTAVRLELIKQGRDLLLRVTGGEAHVGAVAVCHDQGAELMVVPGHKEGPLAAECAEAVALAAGCTCTAVAGIHQDEATGEEIAAIVANVRKALGILIESLSAPISILKEDHEQP